MVPFRKDLNATCEMHIEALELDEIPAHLLAIGVGYIGLELSQAMRRFGSKVSVIERNEQLMHREDEGVTEALYGLFRTSPSIFVECKNQADMGEIGPLSIKPFSSKMERRRH